MALPEPPQNIPRIVAVLDPGDNSHEVHVRMPTVLTAKFPNNAWGTAITAIGLATKDSDRFSGYTLRDIRPMGGGTSDLLWIFYKLTGPTITESKWDPDLGVQIQKTTNLVPPPDVTALAVANTSISKITYGMSEKETQVIPTTALNAYSRAYPIRINLDLPRVLKSINVIWNSQYSIGTQATAAYDYASGVSGSVSLSIPDSASSSASITAELQVTFEDFATNNLFAENREFYMEGPVTQATVLAKLGVIYTAVLGVSTTVAMWPVFKPKSETLVVTGQSIAVRANVSVGLSYSWNTDTGANSYSKNTSVSDDFTIGVSNNSVQLPPCIHPLITLTGDTTRSQVVSATATMALTSTYGASASAAITKTGTAYGSVSPTHLAATSGQNTIPVTGLYLLDMQVAPASFTNWFRVRAEIFNAANLA